MGTIFFNQRNGKFFERTLRQRRVPPGFKDTGHMNYRYRRWAYESYYCPVCGYYHAVFWYANYSKPVWKAMLITMGGSYGCQVAETLVHWGLELGGRRQHYELVKRLYVALGRDINQLEWWCERLCPLGSRQRRRVARMILEGRISEAKAYLAARELGGR